MGEHLLMDDDEMYEIFKCILKSKDEKDFTYEEIEKCLHIEDTKGLNIKKHFKKKLIA